MRVKPGGVLKVVDAKKLMARAVPYCRNGDLVRVVSSAPKGDGDLSIGFAFLERKTGDFINSWHGPSSCFAEADQEDTKFKRWFVADPDRMRREGVPVCKKGDEVVELEDAPDDQDIWIQFVNPEWHQRGVFVCSRSCFTEEITEKKAEKPRVRKIRVKKE